MNPQNTAEIVLALTPVIALIATSLVKKFLPKIPGYILPIVAALVGVLPDYLTSVATGSDTSSLTAALLGLAATGLHQIKTQIGKAAEADAANK